MTFWHLDNSEFLAQEASNVKKQTQNFYLLAFYKQTVYRNKKPEMLKAFMQKRPFEIWKKKKTMKSTHIKH